MNKKNKTMQKNVKLIPTRIQLIMTMIRIMI